VVVTSHSPDLLNDENLSADSILGVHAERGSTHIATLDPSGREALSARLYTPGELLQMGQLRPDPAPVPQPQLFEREHD
jgi:hypothetical protein